MADQPKDQTREKGRSEYLTTQQLAEILQTSRGTIDRLRRAGRIPYIRVSERVIRFNLRDVRHSLTIPTQHLEGTAREDEGSDNQLSFEELFAEKSVSPRS